MTTLRELKREFVDLLEEQLGGRAISCSDDWFAGCENLVKKADPVFKEGHFVSTGQWMDGWESRRSFGRYGRGTDHDWCVLRLGSQGTIKWLNIDTTHFRGNAPEEAAIDYAYQPKGSEQNLEWAELLPKTLIEADSHNLLKIDNENHATHVRLRIYPDGGVARLRAFGDVKVNRSTILEGELVDLASILLGGKGEQCSNEFYSSPNNLLMPKPGINMGDGWETKRRRDKENDWCIIKLGVPGDVRKAIVDTSHFKGNYPDYCTIEGTVLPRDGTDLALAAWETILEATPLQPDREHIFVESELSCSRKKFTHIRLNIFPDGGVSRLRIIGAPEWDLVE